MDSYIQRIEGIQEELLHYAIMVQLKKSKVSTKMNLMIISLQNDSNIGITFLSSFCALNDNDIESALLDISSDCICKIQGFNAEQKGLFGHQTEDIIYQLPTSHL